MDTISRGHLLGGVLGRVAPRHWTCVAIRASRFADGKPAGPGDGRAIGQDRDDAVLASTKCDSALRDVEEALHLARVVTS